jgi:hypothetical protein
VNKNRQHYVPQFYLREFSITDTEYQVFCFDKKTGRKFVVSTRKIAAEKGFYSGSVEGALGDLEGKMSSSYRALLELQDVGRLSLQDKVGVAVLIATQHMRTRDFRNVIKEAFESALGVDRGLCDATESEALNRLRGKFMEEEPARKLQSALMSRGIPEFAAALLKMKWILFVNETKLPFWCSDNPFTYSNLFPYDEYDGLGFERFGSQTHFPLNPRLSLEIVDPVTYAGYSSCIVIDDPESVVFNNHLQVKNARRYVFSSVDDFALAKQMIRENPGLKDVDDSRFGI